VNRSQNSLLFSASAPSAIDGADGSTLYGVKTASGWPSTGVSLVGAAGANGTNGVNGNRILTGSSAPGASDGSGENRPLADTTTPGLINFNNVVVTGLGSTGNSWNASTGTFTVGSAGAGLHYIQSYVHTPDASTPSQTVPVSMLVEINGASFGSQGNIIYGPYPTLSTSVGVAGLRGWGEISTMVYLNANDTFKVKGIGANSSTASKALSTDAGSNLMVVKVN
jgi:hypothetical protein